MGQVCDADREIIEAEERQSSMQMSLTKPQIVLSAPPQEKTVLMAPAEGQKEKKGVKSRAVLLEGGLQLPQKVKRRMNELGPLSLSGSYFAPKCQTYQLDNGIQYEGEWQGEDIHGRGAFLLPDGSYLEANVQQNEVVGKGRLICSNGDYYEGEFRNNRAHGHGKYQQGKVTFEGQFYDNLPHGGAIETGQNSRFIGSYEKGSRREGKLTWRDELGSFTYSGRFKDNLFSGMGSLEDGQNNVTGRFEEGELRLSKRLSKKTSFGD